MLLKRREVLGGVLLGMPKEDLSQSFRTSEHIITSSAARPRVWGLVPINTRESLASSPLQSPIVVSSLECSLSCGSLPLFPPFHAFVTESERDSEHNTTLHNEELFE
jgi:hypothetical protein